MDWHILGILLLVSAVLCSIGFYKHVYFLSIGYGFAIAGLGIALWILFGAGMDAVGIFSCIVLILYGVRLSGFLLYREYKNAAYRKTLKSVAKNENEMSFFAKAGIWVGVSLLYVAEVCPVFFRLSNHSSSVIVPVLGMIIALFGLAFETIADRQKTKQKAENPHMAAMKGLYKIVRCPNYYGEILFWTGITISGLSSLQGIGQWLIVILEYVTIFGVMVSGAVRLEKRQNANYGSNPQYQAYIATTPILFPGIPLYTFVKENQK